MFNGTLAINAFQKLPMIQREFSSKFPLPFHVWDIFGSFFFFFPPTERELRKFQHVLVSASALFQSRYQRMIDEPVKPTVADRESWQKFSVTERNLKYLFHLLY